MIKVSGYHIRLRHPCCILVPMPVDGNRGDVLGIRNLPCSGYTYSAAGKTVRCRTSAHKLRVTICRTVSVILDPEAEWL